MACAELICRSSFSLLEGASHPDELVEQAVALGLSHLALTDRDAVYGAAEAHKLAAKRGLHLIHGARLSMIGGDGRFRPAVLLVQDERGWANLCRLLSAGRAADEKGRARTAVELLLRHADGNRLLLPHGWSPDEAAPLREAFDDRLAVAWTRTLAPGDLERLITARALARRLGVPIVASQDALYHSKARGRLHDVLSCIRLGIRLSEAGDRLMANAERSLLDEPSLRRRYADLPEAVDEATRIAESCTFSLASLRYNYPHEVVPDGHSAMSWLRELTRQGLVRRYPEGTPASVAQQVDHELKIIEQLDFPSYFLTVNDVVRFARERAILCQGRGSAANSAVCYALGITSVDPARSSLLFERFISPERAEPPDIDVDFEHERREEVIQYVYARYGRERAGMVNEVISYRGRSAIRDVGKVLGLSLDQVDRLARATDRWSAGTGVSANELVAEAGVDPSDPAVQDTLRLSAELKGFPRHLSIHVGGFTISDGPLVELVPIEPASMADRTVIQWDKYAVDDLNFVKVDLLALGMLTAIRKGFDLIRAHEGVDVNLATVPAEDPAVYDMFCRADTVGVFQIESRAQMSMLPRLKPRSFYDLVIEVAIVRPGPIQGGMVHPYLRRRSGEEPVTYVHPALEPILARTLGVPLFQEQVMQIAVAVGGFTPGEADELRRAMGAWRKRGGLDALGQRLVANMIAGGIPEPFAQQIFQQILGFGEYGFPESHAASFALLVYVSGWLKCHHPAAFAAALINSQPMGFYSPRALVGDAQRHGVEVRPICVQRSVWDCTLESGGRKPALRLGLRILDGFGEAEAQRLISARPPGGFRSIADFAARAQLRRDHLQTLAEAGAFSGIEPDRRKAVWQLQGSWHDLPLFAGVERREPEPHLPAETEVEALESEYRASGLSVTRHPAALARDRLRAAGERLPTLYEVSQLTPGRRVPALGLVSCRQRPGTASGVVFMTLEDDTGMINLVVWPTVWAAYREIARNAALIIAEGRMQKEDSAISIVVDRFKSVSLPAAIDARSRDFH
jgi:error-prone DNA polymerase